MKNKKNRYVLYIVLGVILVGVAYTACKDITPAQQRVENAVELKLNK